LITDVLQFRRQAADQCPPEPRANPRRMSELALFGMALRLISAYGSKSRLSKTLETEFQF
jgi:hypothetical protein